MIEGGAQQSSLLRVRSIFFDWGSAARQALHSRKSGTRMFSKRHPMASRALASTFDPWRPAPLSRFRTMQLQALSRCRIRPAGRALDTPGSRHVPSVGRPSRKRARRISPVLSAPSIPRPALPNRRKSSRTHHRTGAGLEFRPCPKGTRLQTDSRSAARGGLRGICGRPGKSGRLPPGSLRPRIFGRTQFGIPPPRRQDGVASAGELGRDSRRHPIIHAKGLPYC